MIKKFFFLISIFIFWGCQNSSKSSLYPTDINISVYFSKTSGEYKNGIDDIMIKDIKSASKSVYVAVYEMTNDKIRDALIDVFQKGIDVKVLVDDTHKNDEDIVALENAGIEVYDDENDSLMHIKFLIVDEEVVWSGSSNYTYYAFYRNYENDVRIESKEIANFYKEKFNELLKHSTKSKIYKSNIIEIYFSPEDNFKSKLIYLINHAKYNIYFMIYAFTDKDIADALIKAYNRGVVVKGVFDEDFNTNKYSQYNYLKDNNIDVLVDGNEFLLHDKVMIIDKNIVITGSYNFTLSANNKNTENSLVIISPQIYQKYENEFFKIYQEGK